MTSTPDTILAAITPYRLVLAMITVNFIAFALFGIDKMLAEAGRRRIAESTLLFWALIGGSPGAYAGRHAFRHKTRKQPFSSNLHLIVVLQILAIGGFVGWHLI